MRSFLVTSLHHIAFPFTKKFKDKKPKILVVLPVKVLLSAARNVPDVQDGRARAELPSDRPDSGPRSLNLASGYRLASRASPGSLGLRARPFRLASVASSGSLGFPPDRPGQRHVLSWKLLLVG